MKKLSVLVVVLVFLSAACKKDKSNEGSYYLTFMLDGVPKVHNINAIATKINTLGVTGITIGGFETASSTTPSFGLFISNQPSGNELKAGFYTDENTDYEILSSYSPNSDLDPAYHAGTTLVDEAARAGATIVNHLRFEITAIDGKSIRGIFSGDHYLDIDPSGAKKAITNGEFYLPLIATP